MPEGQQDHRGIALPIPIGLGRSNESLDLGLGQVFPRPQFGIRDSFRWNSPNNSVWRH
jgi:hypothetical protein